MASNTKPTQVLAICDPGATQEQISTALSSQPEFQLVQVISSLDKLGRDARAAEPEIILIDETVGGQSTVDFLDDLALQLPEVPQVAIISGNDPLLAQQVMLAGARAFLIKPFTQANLLSVLRRVHDLEARRQQVTKTISTGQTQDVRTLRTVAVFSPRGGVGTSTVAANLAISIHEQTGDRVLLVDGKLAFGHLGILLNLRTRNSIADLVPHASALDPAIINDVVSEHASGIHVLLSPSSIQVAQGIRPQELFNILAALQRAFPFVVIDAGSNLTENTVTLMDAADRILLVTNPDLASLYDTSQFIQVGRTLAYPNGKLLVVLNRSGMVGGLRTKDIEAALHHELFAQIPDDTQNAIRSINRGIPLLLKYPRSKASKAIQGLAAALKDMSAADTTAPAPAAVKISRNGSKKLEPSRVVEGK